MPSKRDTLFLETTEVPAAKSIGEITAVLIKAGARDITQSFEAGKPAGVRWSMFLYDRLVWFQLPVKVEPLYTKLLKRQQGVLSQVRRQQLHDRAERVAWRQLLMWVKVQMAMIELNQAEFAQVFLPYVTDSSNRTMWEAVRDSQFKQLEAPKQ